MLPIAMMIGVAVSAWLGINFLSIARKEKTETGTFMFSLGAGFFLLYGVGGGLVGIIVNTFKLWGNSW
jgi:hypothetical protein